MSISFHACQDYPKEDIYDTGSLLQDLLLGFFSCFVLFFDLRVELRALRKLGKCSYAPGPLFGFDTRPCYIVQVALNF